MRAWTCWIFETFGNLNELREAVYAAREAAGPDLPLIAQVTIDDNGNLPGGTAVEAFTRRLNDLPVDVIGCNCSVGPKVMLETIEQMMVHHFLQADVRHAQRRGAGARGGSQFVFVLARIHVPSMPAACSGRAMRILGGCCGTTPEHIKLIHAEAIDRCSRCKRAWKSPSKNRAAVAQALPQVPMADDSPSLAHETGGRQVRSVRGDPAAARAMDASKEIAGARLCAAHGIDCINVPDGPRASARMSAQVTCQLIQREAGVEAVNHFCCRDRNILGIQSELLGAHCAGVRNLICITGDPPRMGSYPDATAVFDVDAIGLVNIVNNLNHGLDIGGNAIGSQTALLIGVGVNPGALNMDEEIRRFEWKVQAGAEYVVTQPVFDLNLLEDFLKRIAHVKIPVICGIWPLTSYRNAEFMVNELRVPVPDEFMERMRRVDSAERSRQEGVAIAREMVERVRGMVQGVQLSAPFGRYQMAIDVAEAIGPR